MRREHIPRWLVPVARVPARTRCRIAETEEMHHLNEKGITVKRTEQTAKPTVTQKSGRFATLCGLLQLKGSGAPKIAGLAVEGAGGMGAAPRRLATRASVSLLVLLVTLGVVGFASAPALAAAPEAPETSSPAKAITGTTATLEGVLNPHALAKAGWYFAYSTELMCLVGPHTTPVQPEEEVKAKLVSIGVTGLEPSRKYTFCMFATNEAGEATPSANEVSFETSALAPEVVPRSEQATGVPPNERVKPHEARLEATVNPNNQEVTKCQFLYGTEASLATNTAVGCEQVTLPSVYSDQGVGVNLSGLAQQSTYYFRAIVENVAHEKTEGPIVHFTTPAETPETLPASAVTVTTATLNGVLSPSATVAGEPGTYEFRYRQSASECQGGEVGEEQATPATPASGSAKDAVSAPITGLLNGTQYTFCLLERNSLGEVAVGPAVTFRTHGAGITEEQALGIETGAATLQASIDPNESSTSYHFEYDTSPYTSGAAHGTSLPAPSEAIGAGTGYETVRVRLQGLQPGTTYYYRVVATDEIETFYGPDKTLTTPIVLGSEPTGLCSNEKQREEQPYGLKLPDCRAYEMVSPVDTNGQDATEPYAESTPRASVSGEAVTYASKGVFADPMGSSVENQFLSRRGPGGWSTQPITPLHDPQKLEIEPTYKMAIFTPELTGGVAIDNASLPGTPALGPGPRVYVADFTNNSYEYVGGSIVNAEAASYDLPLGASIDLSRVVYSASAEKRVFEWFHGREIPVGVTNDGEVMNETTVGSPSGSVFLHTNHQVWHAVSSNASRIYFSSPNGVLEELDPIPRVVTLYVRENAEQPQSPMQGEECTVATDACTVAVSASQRSVPDPHGPQTALYEGASADGSKVFFTSTAELTDDAYTGPEDNAANLYEYELSGSGKPGKLTDLTVDDVGDGAAVQGVVQISEDGSYVYFVAEAKLVEGAVMGAPNLYVSHDGGAPTFITTLDATDVRDWLGHAGDFEAGYKGSPVSNTAVVTPSGTRLAFMSYRELTGYNNRDANTGEPDDEIYLYDAETGGLVCASCNPSGARPIGSSSLSSLETGGSYSSLVEYRSRNLIEDGTLFFNSFDALVPHTSDGRENVYEYEDGHINAISDVAGGFNSFLLDVGANGDNVFFGTADQLLPEDTSNNVAVYDARVDGGFPVRVVPPPCNNGDACKPPPTPQPAAFGAPASATFSGAGNVAPVVAVSPPVQPKGRAAKCKKDDVKKKGKCIRARRSKKKAKKATSKKRGN